MDKGYSFLVKWFIEFIEHRDVLIKKIQNIEKNVDGYDVKVTTNDKIQYFIVKPFIDNLNDILERIKSETNLGLVVYNTKENLKLIINHWDQLVNHRDFVIYFINPFSELDTKWIIYPYTHQMVCERKSLEKGLKTMFDTVGPISKEEINKKIS